MPVAASGERTRRAGARTRLRAIRRASESGQASLELVAILPVVLLVGAVVWQLALAGHTAWLTANAARAAARAETVGRSAAVAARSALPRALERDLEVDRLENGRVRVSVRVPLLMRRWGTPVRVAAAASLGDG
ncbi:MAG: TadE/TadG family type IV pilus assembly protein [Thermoleophilaceae bacterium]